MLSIHPLRPWDVGFCWRLAHERSVRLASVDRRNPRVGDHLRWMYHWLTDEHRQAWVVRIEDGEGPFRGWEPAALVRAMPVGGQAVLSVAVVPIYRGRGIAQHAIHYVTEWVREQRWGVPTAYIREGNEPSLRAFRACGYVVTRDAGEFLMMQYRESL